MSEPAGSAAEPAETATDPADGSGDPVAAERTRQIAASPPTSAWRYAAAAVRGTAHVRNGLPCQDAAACLVVHAACGELVLVAVASDGAGSAKCADVGAALCCAEIAAAVERYLGDGGIVAAITRERVEAWVTAMQAEVAAKAARQEMRPRELAATLVAAVVGADAATFFQVGDGAIVVPTPEADGEYLWVFWPNNGEYENITYFATEPNALEHLEHTTVERPIDDVALFTDGLQRLALHYRTRTAHAPFFRPMLAGLHSADAGDTDRIAQQLAAYLASPQVDERTDDDRTLILASRR